MSAEADRTLREDPTGNHGAELVHDSRRRSLGLAHRYEQLLTAAKNEEPHRTA